VLLSRVADAVYWTGRYLERAEATARLVKVHTELFLDLPKSASTGWEPLLAVTGTHEPFTDHYNEPSEEHVVAFLAVDGRNSSSVVASLARARENMRTTRAVFPREVWESLNNLFLETTERAEDAVTRRRRLQWIDDVLGDCQRLTGTMAGAMSHDDAYGFLRIGRNLERADMTTRVLDVGASTLITGPRAEQVRPYADITWMSVLKALSAYHMYRRSVQDNVTGAEVVRFLLKDTQFPRSVEHCLTVISQCLLELPRHEAAMKVCAATEHQIDAARVQSLAFEGLHDYVDELQLLFDELHYAMSDTYFQSYEPDEGERRTADPAVEHAQTQTQLAPV
jgi:uncharacterized alpha-E superfamily protein